ncbi:Transmembrane amino acid transporter [Blattamonas nauphoetae]|uniref:Transmembrane amino acid transporter n=1 Tax=Blattamonas nauphoetae TaxID=2049346 RepID=A0ABQ9X6P3_9EUKA|nr:Transmembrane amino acid transporter [Blattamonas nauphoetae]
MKDENKPLLGKAKTPKKAKPATIVSGTINLVNTVIGAGTLGLPYAFAKAGLLPAILMFIALALLSYLTMYYIAYASDVTLCYSCGDIASKLYGPIGILLISLIVFIKCFGVLWSYSVLVGDFLISLLQAMRVPATSFVVNRYFITPMVGFFVYQPLSWFERVDSLKMFSFASIISMLYVVFVVVLRFIWNPAAQIHAKPEIIHPSPTIIQTFSMLCFAFGCHQTVPILQGELKKKDVHLMNRVGVLSFIIVAAIYFTCGLFGYLQFTNIFFTARSPGNVLTLFPDNDWFALVARICLTFVVIISFPLLVIPARSSLWNIIRVVKDIAQKPKDKPMRNLYPSGRPPPLLPNEWKDKKVCGPLTKYRLFVMLFGSGLTTGAILLGMFVSKVDIVFDIIGSTAGCAVGFVIPAMFYIRCRTHPEMAVSKDRHRILVDTSNPVDIPFYEQIKDFNTVSPFNTEINEPENANKSSNPNPYSNDDKSQQVGFGGSINAEGMTYQRRLYSTSDSPQQSLQNPTPHGSINDQGPQADGEGSRLLSDQYLSSEIEIVLPEDPANDDEYQKAYRKYMVKHPLCDVKNALAIVVMIFGVVCGACSLTMSFIKF